MDSVSEDDAPIDALQRQIAELEEAGMVAEAIPLAERCVEAARARFGENHPSYAAALTTLAGLLRRANRLEDAEVLLRRAVAVYEQSPEGNQLQLARAFGGLAQLLADAGRVEEAEALRPYAVGAAGPAAPEPQAPPPEPDAPLVDLAQAERTDGQPADPPGSQPAPPASAPGGPDSDLLSAIRRRAEARAPSAVPERTDLPKPRQKVDAKRALEIDAGRLAYQIPRRMWVNVQETLEVRLGRTQAQGLTQGFAGRGEVRTEDVPIVETMSVSLACEPGAFDIVARSEKDQLVKPDLVLGTPFHSDDFGRWVWLVTPRLKGEHTLLVKVSAAIRDSRGLPATSSLPDKTFAVSVRVQLWRAAAGALLRAAPGLAWAVVTALVGVFTKDYWWPAIRHMIGLG